MEQVPAGSGSRAQILLWRSLVHSGLRAGLSYEDAQDLASQAFTKALAAHDPARGPFSALCRTTHGNLLRNHWRDRKPLAPIEGEDLPGGGEDPLEGLVLGREREMMQALSDRILAALDPEEAALFLALSDVILEAEKAAVSEASRRLGIEPLKGWDIFRRIRRKARRHLGEFEAAVGREDARVAMKESAAERQVLFADSDAVPSLSQSVPGPSQDLSRAYAARWMAPLLFLASACADAGFGRFEASLNAEQRARLAALA